MIYGISISHKNRADIGQAFDGDNAGGDARQALQALRVNLQAGESARLYSESATGSRVTLERVSA